MKTTKEIRESLIKSIIKDCIDFDSRVVIIGKMDEYVTNALAEQDQIARVEERERCIKIAQDWNCKIACANGLDCKSDYKERCVVLEGIRKAMEMED